ncbi:glycoside hydrolase family 43 protein [Anditalea andensis]|uniref:Arabinosidase n=1 Tax=Anditalea andensis TaxID=1048983 RepID=A0A074KW99_9BACT|nr:glycoside hydrolase family 43 protein [Anditalea andensis]KEO74251.1 arabinosidase [Anditalea andensis]
MQYRNNKHRHTMKVRWINLAIIFSFFLCSCDTGEQADHVSEAPVEDNDEVYIFTSFREPATEGLYLAYSEDGYTWEDLSGPYLKPGVGESNIMRDPSVVKGPDGTFHMVWTTDWRGADGFGYASTKDFIEWSEQQFIPVMDHEPEVVNVWAPELYYDEDGDRFIIIWASTIPHRFEKGEEAEDNNHRMYYVTTRDFKEFSDTKLFIDPGFSIIDAVIVKRDKEDYVLVLKDNTRPERNLKVAFGDSPLGPYEDISEPFTGHLTEGPTVIEQNGKYLIFFDSYGGEKYDAVKTTDFKTFIEIGDEIQFPEGHKHGTISTIDREILNRLKQRAEILAK